MSRLQHRDNSTNVTLFPFLAVLLCTMGSLLLVLVVMAKVSREKAARAAEIEAQKPPQIVEPCDKHTREHLDQITAQIQRLESARSDAAEVLRKDQLRLRHIEDHMRRLQDQLVSLQLAAAELDAMNEDHFDDRVQAEREVERLQQLIAETRQQIEDLKEEQGDQPRSYAIVPYAGIHGTSRQPLYIECRKDVVLLQPEGIELTAEDFAPPLGAGNPLAAALRAAREFIVNRNPAQGESEYTEPYPLVLVRPEGIGAYYRVRAAIESWDADFGYELLESNCELEFPSPDPRLAAIEYEAVRLARLRQQMLAAAAPRAYARIAEYGNGYHSFDIDVDQQSDEMGNGFLRSEEPGDGGGGSRSAAMTDLSGDDKSSEDPAPGSLSTSSEHASSDSFAGAPATGSSHSASLFRRSNGSGDVADPSFPTQPTGQGADPQRFQSAQRDPKGPADSDRNSFASLDYNSQLSEGGESEEYGGQSGSEGSGPNPTTAPAATNSTGNRAASSIANASGQSSSSAAASLQLAPNSGKHVNGGGSDWAVRGKRPSDVPIRRAVQVIVRHDRISILPDRAENVGARLMVTGGKEIPLPGATEFALEDFVTGVQDHVSNWGIAGSGLYWRPVLMLNVAPDGEKRAADLERLLENSGIEVRNAATAKRTESNDAATIR